MKFLRLLVQNVNEREADSRAKEPVQRVKHCVPAGNHCVVVVDLAENLRCINKEINGNLKRGRNHNMQIFLKECGQEKQDQGEQAERRIFIAPCDK